MSVLIKGMKKPDNCEVCPYAFCHLVNDCPIVEVPTPHGRLIDANALYEKTAEWEAQALHIVERALNDEDESEWHHWSTVLTERSAFKYDVADTLTIIEAEEGERDDRSLS